MKGKRGQGVPFFISVFTTSPNSENYVWGIILFAAGQNYLRALTTLCVAHSQPSSPWFLLLKRQENLKFIFLDAFTGRNDHVTQFWPMSWVESWDTGSGKAFQKGDLWPVWPYCLGSPTLCLLPAWKTIRSGCPAGSAAAMFEGWQNREPNGVQVVYWASSYWEKNLYLFKSLSTGFCCLPSDTNLILGAFSLEVDSSAVLLGLV